MLAMKKPLPVAITKFRKPGQGRHRKNQASAVTAISNVTSKPSRKALPVNIVNGCKPAVPIKNPSAILRIFNIPVLYLNYPYWLLSGQPLSHRLKLWIMADLAAR